MTGPVNAQDFLLIVNPAAKLARFCEPSRMKRSLEGLGVRAEVVVTRRPDEPASEARARGFGRVIAVGGDGTLRSVAAAAGLPVALVPAGTSNSVARSLGIPLGVDAALELAARGRPRRVDAGELVGPRVPGGRAMFLLCASAGPDAEVVRRYEISRGARSGVLRYALAASRVAAFYEPRPISVFVGGRPVARGARLVVAANMPVYGGWFRMSPQALPDDGLLDLVCVRACGPCGVLASLARALRGSPPRAGRALLVRASLARWEGPGDVPVEIDGEPAGWLPVEVRTLAGALEIVCPAGSSRS